MLLFAIPITYYIVILLEKNKDTYNDNLPISIEPYKFKQDDEETQKAWKKEYGIDEKDFLDRLDAMCEQAFDDQCTGANPRYPLISEIKDMYLRAYYGK